MKILYKTKASATGGREGKAGTADNTLSVTLSTPKELGGGGGSGTNPEQLFATGYSACYLGAFKFAASKEKVKIPDDASVTAEVGIGPRDDEKGFGLEVTLTVSVPGMDKAQVKDLADKAHVICPYSHATKGNIQVTTQVA